MYSQKTLRITRWLLACLSLLFFSTRLCSLSLAASNYEDRFLIATDLLNQGMYLESVGIYREIANNAEDANQRARALLFIGTTYSLYLEQYEAAIEIYNQVLSNYPKTRSAGDALFNTGMIQYEQGKFTQAYQTFNTYLKSYPKGMRSQSAAVWADSAHSMALAQPEQTKKPVTPVPGKIEITDTTIRVLISANQQQVSIDSPMDIQLSAPFTQKPIYTGKGHLRLSCAKNRLTINGETSGLSQCILTTYSRTTHINQHPYRGNFIISVDNSGISVVNRIGIEYYLYGVVPKEMPHQWNQQALRAQAIAARTYALYIKSKSGDKAYDVEATTASQVYGGYDGEAPETNAAVDATRGQVMTYHNRLIVAYFHANSGGYTEDPQNVWNAELPYLKGVPDKYSQNIPNGDWQYFLSYTTATRKLKGSSPRIGKINQIKAQGRSQSGRALQIRIGSSSGTATLSANNFRIKIGGTRLKSTLFNMHPNADGILFKGKGYGHGVGMSQWGADKMARSGFTCTQILKYYYREIQISKIGS